MNQVIKERIEKIKNGEVPEGYKSTKSGTIPLNWDSIKLRKLATPIKEKVQNRKLEVLSITAGVGFVNQADKFGKEIAGAQYQNYTVLRKGDFSYNKGNSKTYPQGCIYMLEDRDEAAVPSVFNSFRFKPGIHTCYYKHLFINGFFNKQLYRYINAGVRNDGLLNLYDDDFYDCELPVPSLPEQEKIAEILSTWDKAIALLEKLIEEKKYQKKWLIQNLLNPDSKIRLAGFKGEWKKTTLAAISKYKSSALSISDIINFKGEKLYPVYDANSIIAYVDFYESEQSYISIIKDGAGIGRIARGVKQSSVISTMGYIYPTKGIDELFLFYILNTVNYLKYATGSTIPHVYYSDFKDHQLLIPPTIDEQKTIAHILYTADKEIDLLVQKLEQLQKQKKALMQLLLTGIVRVTIYSGEGR